jgi:hypothetical protein
MSKGIKQLREVSPPGEWGKWAKYMIHNHTDVDSDIVYGLAWKNYKDGKSDPHFSKKQPTKKEHGEDLKRLRDDNSVHTKRSKRAKHD